MRTRKIAERTCERCGRCYSSRADQPQRYCSRQCQHAPFPERFWALVDKGADDECWLWTGSARSGYGLMRVDGRMQGAHRISFLLSGHVLPTGMDVLHRCDTPACVNPSHLFLGTHTDNMRDMVAKRRANHPAKLSPSQVDVIRASSARPVDLAVEHGVSPSTISNIRAGRVWRTAEATNA